jgi:GH15 family glucan-1,4-alpha-glucosidase
VPFELLDINDDVFARTVDEIETKLLNGCGLHRYRSDTYYGGGQWLLMSCWLGWYYSLAGKPEKAEAILAWAENQANEKGELPEQSFEHVYDRSYYDKWYDMFGKPAAPALWTHALYIISALELKRAGLRF